MKNLINIYEKLDINKVNLLPTKFPIDEGTIAIVKFLKDNGFIEIPYSKNDIWSTVHNKFAKKKGKKVFAYWPNVRVLRFADMSKDINRENPIFCINDDRRVWLELLHNVNDIRVKEKEFLELLNKVFDWK